MEPNLTLVEAQQIVSTKVHPRVTIESIQDKIKNVDYIMHKHLTICVIEMANGFFLTGESAPADIRNYDKEVGERYAYDNALKKAWQLEGYSLRDRLSNQ
jgi:hypothetical protein